MDLTLIRAAILVAILGQHHCFSQYSGIILDPSGQPKSGVKVESTILGTSGTSDNQGKWEILPQGSNKNKLNHRSYGGGKVVVENVNGHLFLRFRSHILSGREDNETGTETIKRSPSGELFRGVSNAIQWNADTLVYSFGGKIFLKDTASTQSFVGIRMFDTTVNPNIIHGYFLDKRDSNIYRTVRFNQINQEWLAQNLRFRQDRYSCQDLTRKHCLLLGRSYTWPEALSIDDSCLLSDCKIPENWQGICPDGWFVPSNTNWSDLVTFFGNDFSGFVKGIATKNSVWNSIDPYGFNAISTTGETGVWFASTLTGKSGVLTGFSCGYYGGENFSCSPSSPSKSASYLRCVRSPDDVSIESIIFSTTSGELNYSKESAGGLEIFRIDSIEAKDSVLSISPKTASIKARSICYVNSVQVGCSQVTIRSRQDSIKMVIENGKAKKVYPILFTRKKSAMLSSVSILEESIRLLNNNKSLNFMPAFQKTIHEFFAKGIIGDTLKASLSLESNLAKHSCRLGNDSASCSNIIFSGDSIDFIVEVADEDIVNKYTFKLSKGVLKDMRDQSTYKIASIGNNIWMIESLRYKTSDAICFNNDTIKCKSFGLLYLYARAANDSSNIKLLGHNKLGICPIGWRLPTQSEAEDLFASSFPMDPITSKYKNSGSGLKSKLWAGSNTTLFSALPSGYVYDGVFVANNQEFYSWISGLNEFGNHQAISLSTTNLALFQGIGDKASASIRCVME